MNIEKVLTELTEIPAPSGKEQKRAEYIKNYLKKSGYNPVIDEAGNVLVEFTVDESEPYTVLMAHMDTVFEDEDIVVNKNDSILIAPGIGDDTSNVVLMLKALEEIKTSGAKPAFNLLFAFNTCEEGTGNLKGIRCIMQEFKGRVREVISFDLTCDFICVKAVGSIRYRVDVKTQGGHSYADFGRVSAVEVAAEMISEIYKMTVINNDKIRTTYNVGTVNGGTSVNTIAQNCTFTAEVRSDDKDALLEADNGLTGIFKKCQDKYRDSEVSYEIIGERPTGNNVPKDRQNILTDKASEIIRKYTGIKPAQLSGSTDCNIPLSLGIPAISFGCYKGGGAHTRQEWVDMNFMDTGYNILKEFVWTYFD